MEFNELLQHFGNVKQEGGSQWRANCPACGDTKRHLYIMQAPDKVLFDCKKGCSFKDIISAAGLTLSDCFAEQKKVQKWELIREHFYTDMQGGIIAKKQIYNTGGNKQAVWYRLEKGQYVKGLDGAKMPLYHLHKLTNAGRTIVVAEGEKDVETLERLGYTATTSPNGAGTKWRTEWAEFFKGKNVAVITDNDEAGRKYGVCAADVIIKTAAAVKMIPASEIYPAVKPKGDISDIAAELGDTETRRLLSEAVKNADNYSLTIGASKNDSDTVKLYTLDDTGNAERIYDNFGDRLLYNFNDKSWYYWDKTHWHKDDTGTIKRIADASLDIMASETEEYVKQDLINSGGEVKLDNSGTPKDGELTKAFKKHIKTSRSSKSKNAMVTELQHKLPALPGTFDKHPYLFNTPRGTVDLKSGKLLDHDKTKYITKMAGTTVSDTAAAPIWCNFLDTVFCGDKELIRYVQKAVGYSLSGSIAEQCMFFLHGNGHNGKSTFLELLRALMGDYCVNAQIESFMISHRTGSNATSDIARLKGARLVTASEPNEGVRFDEGLIKQLTGGDVVTARYQYASEFEYTPEFKIWIAANHRPIIRGTDIGIWRRIHVIPFNANIPESKKDRSLPQKLKTELPAILRWAINGYTLYSKEGLRKPAAVAAAVQCYKREMDVISAFIDACCIIGDGSVQSSYLYSVYKSWAENNNEYAMSHTKFTTELSKREGITKVHTRDGADFKGITLKNNYDDFD